MTVPDPEGPLLVSIDFETTLAAEAFAAQMEAGARFVAAAPGLIWKVWGWNEASRRATGSYLFASQAAVDAYVGGLFRMGPPSRDGYGGFDILVTRVMDAPIDRLPVRPEGSAFNSGPGAQKAAMRETLRAGTKPKPMSDHRATGVRSVHADRFAPA